MALSALPEEGLGHRPFKMVEGGRGEVREVAVRGVVPDVFSRIELRGVGREPSHTDGLAVRGQPGLDAHRPVRPVLVPNEGETVWEVPAQRAREPEDLPGSDVVTILGPVEDKPAAALGHREDADRGEPVPALPPAEERRVPSGGARTPPDRLEQEAALVVEDETPTGAAGVL